VPEVPDLGTAVRVSLSGGWATEHAKEGGMTEEGIVIEAVPPGAFAQSARVVLHPSASPRSKAARYVVQCNTRRVLRRGAEKVVMCL
jgi:hypothetical protein